ncbi:hypothetical protein ACHQM5_023590 [Ranunculus cassubicifolius]
MCITSSTMTIGCWIPREKERENYIRLKVKNQHDKNKDAVFVMKMRKTTKLKKLMATYSDHLQMDFGEISFVFDGRRIKDDQTPNDLEMEEGDIIDAMLYMCGG